MKTKRRNFRRQSMIFLLVICLLLIIQVDETYSQEGPQCPPGFTFEPLSGVGCLQENCFDIDKAYFDYTGHCVCAENYKMCTKPIDYGNIAQNLCGPFCPVSELISCVSLDSECKVDVLPEKNEDNSIKPPIFEDPNHLSLSDEDRLTSLLKDLENFLTGKSKREITSEGVAAAGAVTISLLGAWILTQLLNGNKLDDLLNAITSFLEGSSPKQPVTLVQKSEFDFVKPPIPPSHETPIKNLPIQTTEISDPIQTEKPIQAQDLPKDDNTPTLVPDKKAVTKGIEIPPSADPEKVELLQEKFKEMVNLAVENNMYVMNRSLLEKVWNKMVMFDGAINTLLQGKYGGQCGEYAQWGENWTNVFAKDIFGEGVIVDTIYIGEKSSISKETMITDPLERIDRFIESNHAATRVILPTGETYILDYWQAIGDHQKGLFEKSVEIAYDHIFGGKPKYPEIKIMTEREWVNHWRPKIETMFDKAVVHNINPSQSLLQDLIRKNASEEVAFENFKKGIFGKGVNFKPLSEGQSESIINSYKRGGVWWDQLNER